MSLVGSLEDLSLGDILQIISLSQKSGVLSLKTTGCDGRIVFVNGLVRGACIKGGPLDLRGVLVDGGFLAEDEYTAAAEQAKEHGDSVADAVGEITSLSRERVESLCREAIESAVVTMFSWQTGDFSFDVRSASEREDPELLLPTGINAQYLAMEGARVADEDGNRHDDAESDDDDIDEMSAHDFFGVSADSPVDDDQASEQVETPRESEDDAVQALAMATARRSDTDDTLGEDDLIAPEPILHATLEEEEALDAEMIPEEGALELVEDSASDADAPVPPLLDQAEALRPLVALDSELPVLEWLKQSIGEDFSPVHIFQNTDQALQRVRQYLVRGQPPVLLISPKVRLDGLSGIRDSVDFIARLKSQSSRLVALWLCEAGADRTLRMGAADGVVTRPSVDEVQGRLSPEALEELGSELAQKLRIDVASASSKEVAAAPIREGNVSPDAIRRLRDATRALTEASSRGEVLPLVIRFASEVFTRVAMFMVRDGRAVGIAGHGLSAAGGPDDAGLREISMDPAQSLWMSSVLEHGKPVQGTADNDGDRMLVTLLGDRPPGSAYMAPIESTGQVIALLYGDNLPDDEPIGDTSALEVVLHHAGLALDRAALERALQEQG